MRTASDFAVKAIRRACASIQVLRTSSRYSGRHPRPQAEALDQRTMFAGGHDYIWREAENFISQSSASGHSWQPTNVAGFSGSGMQASPNDSVKVEVANASTAAPSLSYQATFAGIL